MFINNVAGRTSASYCRQYDINGEVCVGPTLLPASLPADTTPTSLLERRANSCAEDVMKAAVQQLGYTLEVRNHQDESDGGVWGHISVKAGRG